MISTYSITQPIMKTKHTIYPILATIMVGSAHAALYMNVGLTGTSAGQGPTGADANYLSYVTTHEDESASTTGQLTTFNSISFSEGGLGGTYDVGVAFTWPGNPARQAKQAFDNRNNPRGFAEFWESWIGTDSRVSGGNSFQLNLTGLEANQTFTFTSYHTDTADQGATFTVDQTPSSSEASTSPFTFRRGQSTPTSPLEDLATLYAYSFDVTSDASGNLDVTYTLDSGTFLGVNGFDLEATVIPEPSSSLLIALGSVALILRRRR